MLTTSILRLTAAIHKFIMQRMNRRYIQFVCGSFLAICLAALALSLLTQKNGRTIFGPNLGADYASFYVAGRIYNEVRPDQIYNLPLQTRLYRQVTHDPDLTSALPFSNTPFFVVPFALLARIPYGSSYILWLVFAAGLYVAGMRLTWNGMRHLEGEDWKTVLLLGVTFVPFLLESLIGGQVSAFGLFWLTLAIFLERRGRPGLSGLALSFCLYKPTLLLLVLPMLLLTSRWRTLAGFGLGAFSLAVLSVSIVSLQGMNEFFRSLIFFAGQSTTPESGLRTWKYIDFNSFFRLLVGGYPVLRWGLLLITVAAISPLLVRAWRQSRGAGPDEQSLVWALTLGWTTVLNLYVGIYDAVLLVPSAMLAADFILGARQGTSSKLPTSFKYLLLLLYITPWFTEFIAFAIHIQIITLVISAYGLYLLFRRMTPEI